MKNTKDVISATFHHGEKVSLTNFWQDTGVICPNSKFFYVLDGEIVLKTESEEIIARQGEMVLLPAGIKHDFHLTDKRYAKKYWMHVDISLNGENLFDYYTLPYKIYVGQNDHLKSLFETVLRYGNDQSLSSKLTASSALLSLVSFYVEHSSFLDSQKDDEIDIAIKYVKSHYTEKFSLDELCAISHLSKGHFLRKFKERTGHTPMHYVNKLKIDKAKTMIEQSNQPINTIMESLGFYDSAHFCKLFKSLCGYSPKEFRAHNYYRKMNEKI